MRIALYMTTVLEHPGGCEKYLAETAAQLSERPGISADVITMDEHFTQLLGKGLSAFYLKKREHVRENERDVRRRLGKAHYHKIHTLKQLKKVLRTYDVIYSKNELLEGFVLRFLLGYKQLPPVVFGGHTPLHYANPQSFHARLHNMLYGGRLYRFLASGVHKFHALNNDETSLYKQHFPNRQVTKIYNPFDLAAFKKTAVQHVYPRLNDFDTTVINILWVGRLTEQKGVTDLAAIIPVVNEHLKGTGVPIAWNICGDGELRPLVETLERQETNVHYFGHIAQKYMASIYQRCQLFLSTSKWEGYPYTLIEPQAFGLQVFAYRISGVEDILDAYDGSHGADDKEQLCSLLVDKLTTYGTPTDVPTSPSSVQFQPERIYDQILELLGASA
jgi:glycosyltransferase involved in cell wall biosynthesis